MSLNFENLIHNDTISSEDHSNAMELSEELEAYEPNELVLKASKDLESFFDDESNCSCRKKKNKLCFKKIGIDNFLERQFQLKGLDNNELDLCIKTQLMVFQSKSKSKNENNETVKYDYKYQYNSSIPICQPVFLKLCGITKYKLLVLQEHLSTDGLMERIHGNTKNVPHNKSHAIVDIEIAQLFKEFLFQYTNLHGLPSPMKIRDDLEAIIYLPTYMKYTTVYEEFKKHFNLEYDPNRIIAYNTFYKLWQQLTPYIKFQQSATDLCDTCEAFKTDIKFAKEKKKENLKFEYTKHQTDVE